MSDIDVYIYSGESQNTHTCACTHTISYMHIRLRVAYPQKQLLYCLMLYTSMFHCFNVKEVKEVDAPKGEEQVFFMTQLPARTTLVEHEARFVLGSTAVLRNSREIKICLNAELPTH